MSNLLEISTYIFWNHNDFFKNFNINKIIILMEVFLNFGKKVFFSFFTRFSRAKWISYTYIIRNVLFFRTFLEESHRNRNRFQLPKNIKNIKYCWLCSFRIFHNYDIFCLKRSSNIFLLFYYTFCNTEQHTV